MGHHRLSQHCVKFNAGKFMTNKNRQISHYDVAFCIHGLIAVIFILFWVGDNMATLFPQLTDKFQTLWELAMFSLIPLSIIIVPIVLIISLCYWRDWKILLPGILLFWLLVVVMSTSQQGVNLMATIYVLVSSATTVEWFIRRRKQQQTQDEP